MSALRKLNDWADRYPLATYICVVVGVAIAMWQIESLRSESQGQNEQTLGSIIAVQIENCQNDRRFREQYRKRGEAEKLLLDLFLSLARRAVAEGKDPEGTSKDFLEKFAPLSREIHIIPVPDCKEVGQRLREVIENTGVTVPPIPELEALTLPPAREGVIDSNGHAPSSQPGPPAGGSPGKGKGGGKPSQPNPPPPIPGVSKPPASPVPQPVPSAPNETGNDQLPNAAPPKAEPPGLLSPTVEGLPEQAQGPVKKVCDVADQIAHLC
jgi:hypothetical protein